MCDQVLDAQALFCEDKGSDSSEHPLHKQNLLQSNSSWCQPREQPEWRSWSEPFLPLNWSHLEHWEGSRLAGRLARNKAWLVKNRIRRGIYADVFILKGLMWCSVLTVSFKGTFPAQYGTRGAASGHIWKHLNFHGPGDLHSLLSVGKNEANTHHISISQDGPS